MMRIPSVGLIEIMILAAVAGLALLAGGLILVIVVKRQRGRTNGADAHPGPEATTSRASNPGLWLLLVGLVAVLLLPLVVIVGGIVIITPVRSTRTVHQEPAPAIHVVEISTPMGASLASTPEDGVRPTTAPGEGLAEAPPPGPASLSMSPDNNLIFLTLPAIAGLAVLLGVAVMAIILRRWRGSETGAGRGSKAEVALIAFAVLAALSLFVFLTLEFSLWVFVWSVVIFAAGLILIGLLLLAPRLLRRRGGEGDQLPDQGVGDNNGDEWTRTAWLRYALLALAIWFGLSIFLIMDVGYSVSVYWQFVAIYAAFCVLVGLLLLVGSPKREKLLLLGLLVVVLFSLRFVDWNSRKPFLRDLYRVQEGMSVEQVEEIMGKYMGGACCSAKPLDLSAGEGVTETEGMAQPDRLVYRHTSEGWGDSDWGEVHFENGRVVEIQFLPD
jgi:hypothetical protein